MLAAMLSSRVWMNRSGPVRAGAVILALGFAAAYAPAATAADDEPEFTPAPCASYSGGSVTALACGSGAGKGAGIDLTHPDGTVESTRAVVADLGPGWVAQRVDVAPGIGDVVGLRDPTGTAQELRLRVRGTEGQPYAVRVVVPPATGPVAAIPAASLRLVDDGIGGVAVDGAPSGYVVSVTPGVTLAGDPSLHLGVDDEGSAALWFGNATVQRLELSFLRRDGSVDKVPQARLSRQVRGASEVWRFRGARGSAVAFGRVWVDNNPTPTRLLVYANVPVFKPEPSKRADEKPSNPPAGEGRPTK